MPLDRSQVVLEILEGVVPDAATITTLTAFRERGYTIALDDFVSHPQLEPFLNLAHIVKLDVLTLSPAELQQQVPKLKARGLRVLAEKVETHEQFAHCAELGCDLFQGFFFARPKVLTGKSLPSNRLLVMKLLAKLQDPEADLEDIEAIIAHDIALTYRLLRYINSAWFGLRSPVDSIRRALIMLGTNALRNWASLFLLARIDDKPRELMTVALVRAKMCEGLSGEKNRAARDQYFTVGLFSVLDALMDRPMGELLEGLPLSGGVKQALLERSGRLGEVLTLVLDYEQGRWDRVARSAISPTECRESYIDALRWASTGTEALAG
jgi:EAL and modified HD-GYP domain-containing signal transduction protein